MKSSMIASLLMLGLAHGLQLSAQEKDDIKAEIDAWKKSRAGQLAAKNGLLPEPSNLESGEIDDGSEEIERFAHTKQVVAELNKKHPHAKFSTNNQFALMTEDEFAAFVKGSFSA
ncbi:hypothetical protein SDRG_09743 [Saprolegnia diclina VS20]|uniref:Cathepsin propeptide inhibitor domain-containing protein n=1 Tax=Saprolegnia diclina (strain VS20) TaxID=1156394 RepID=T0QDE7_SAPDV|nr:hypothetical protein SDRG_09743 [Saprolegnia diclina VS20]EQC32771.1 hypothetical protein SDRG_09743 [Saprolegnia diclina VS20]|eukprot:XP_008613915.1 hypothetical protein SDRG_09743 [Saprolegnia diclina VS20]